MVSRNKIRVALTTALDEIDPERKVINWRMVEFRHELKKASDIPGITKVWFEFTEADIKNELTVAVFENTDRTLRLIYDYKTEKVECLGSGKDIESGNKFFDVHEFMDFVKEFFPVKKRVIVIRKKK